MTEKKDDQGLSFKEQILRDLENIKNEESSNGNPEIFGADMKLEPVEQKKNLIDEEALFGVKKPEEPATAGKVLEEQLEEQLEATSEPAAPVEEVPVAQPEVPDVVYPSIEEMMALQKQQEQERQAPEPEPERPATIETRPKPASVDSIPVSYAQTASSAESQVDSPVSRNPAVKVPHSEIVEEAQKRAQAAAQTPEERIRTSRKAKKKRRNRLAGRIVATVLVIIILLLGVTGYVGYNYINSALQPIDKTSKEYVTVEIPAGSSAKGIGNVLEKAGLIRNATVFNYYTQVRNYSGFQSGYYNLQKSMSVDQLAKALQKGGTETPQPPVIGKVTIPEGYTLTQISTAVQTATKKAGHEITADDFMAKAQDDAFINQMVSKYPRLLASLPSKDTGVLYRLEGYLFPATYNLAESTTAEDLIDQMLAAMDKNLSGYYDQIAAQNHTVNEILSLASLVEKEGSTDEDRKNIASVFFNRMAQGMPLQSNIAILYAQGKLGEKTSLAEDAQVDTNIDSPFNIYANTGLTPGPVDSPSLSAIDAVVSPNTTDYLYFVADVKTGKVYFANNYAEHEQNVQTYVNDQIASSSSDQQQ